MCYNRITVFLLEGIARTAIIRLIRYKHNKLPTNDTIDAAVDDKTPMRHGSSLLTPETSPPGPRLLDLSQADQLERGQRRDGQYNLTNILQRSSLGIDAIGNPINRTDGKLIGF